MHKQLDRKHFGKSYCKGSLKSTFLNILALHVVFIYSSPVGNAALMCNQSKCSCDINISITIKLINPFN